MEYYEAIKTNELPILAKYSIPSKEVRHERIHTLLFHLYKLSEWQIQSTMEECKPVIVWVRGSGRQIDREEAQENFWRLGGASWVYTFVKSHWSLPLNVCNLLYIINNISIKFILLKKQSSMELLSYCESESQMRNKNCVKYYVEKIQIQWEYLMEATNPN